MIQRKKSWVSLLALLLCALLLSGCGLPRSDELSAMLRDRLSRMELAEKRVETIARDEDMPRFSQMPYERPDLAELEARIAAAEEAMDAGKSYWKVVPLLDECFEYYYHYSTMYSLADIRSCQDLTDEYYTEEYEWCAENFALVDQALDGLYYACAASPIARALERSYFWEGFVEQYSDESESIYTDTMVALMQEESALISEYRALSADPVIDFEGDQVPLYEILPKLRGQRYNNAVVAYYTQYNEAYADLFIRMVAVREKMAAELGYDSYEQMQYLYGFERDYTAEQAEAYLRDIQTWMVPLYQDLLESSIPEELWYSRVSEDFLRELLQTAAKDIGGEVQEAFDFMLRYELCDVSVDSRKADMSFQTYLDEYEAPFVFLNAEGDTDDILSFAHEFGHFCDAYVNLNAYETVDLAEIYSQGMEYLMLSRLGEQLEDDEVENIARLKMIDTVEMYVQQASFAEFEHRVYELGAERLDAETLNEISRQTAIDYGYYDADYDPFYSLSWVDIIHFFEQPFYVVSYPVSNDMAMQIYALEREQAGSGMDCYLEALHRDFSGMMGLVDASSLESPFAEGRVAQIAAVIREVLGL